MKHVSTSGRTFLMVYLVENLKASATMIGISSVATNVASMPVQRKAGVLSDRWEPRHLQLLKMLLV